MIQNLLKARMEVFILAFFFCVSSVAGAQDNSCSTWDISEVRYGDEVYTRFLQIGNFKRLRPSGREVEITVSGFMQVIDISDIAIQGCHLGLASDQWVETIYGDRGVVGGIFSSGDVMIKFPSLVVWYRSELRE